MSLCYVTHPLKDDNVDGMEHGIEWAAGFFEGEGSISWSARSMSLDVAQVDLQPLEWFAKAVGLGRITGPYSSPAQQTQDWQPKYFWRCRKKNEVLKTMDLLLPYLSNRRIAQWEKLHARWIDRSQWTPERRLNAANLSWETRRGRYGQKGHR
jgi:hypothetical protein